MRDCNSLAPRMAKFAALDVEDKYLLKWPYILDTFDHTQIKSILNLMVDSVKN